MIRRLSLTYRFRRALAEINADILRAKSKHKPSKALVEARRERVHQMLRGKA